jgi:hypothetical protein
MYCFVSLKLCISSNTLLPQTEEQAPTYRDIVTQPMDLRTMKTFAEQGRYKSFQMLRHDVELMAHNALAFNSSGDRCVGIGCGV